MYNYCENAALDSGELFLTLKYIKEFAININQFHSFSIFYFLNDLISLTCHLNRI